MTSFLSPEALPTMPEAPPELPASPSSPPQAATASAMVSAPKVAANRVMRMFTLLETGVLDKCVRYVSA